MGAQKVDWDLFLADFHRSHPGITEQLLSRSFDAKPENPYQWLAAHVPEGTSAVLDIGCGSAPMQSALPPKTAYVGIDVSMPELKAGRKKGRERLVCASALDLPILAGSVDFVVSSMAVMLLSPIEKALDEVFRVLKPGGTFVFIQPTATPFIPRDLLVGAALTYSLRSLPAMPQRFPKRRIRDLLRNAGFDSIRHESKRFAFRLSDAGDASLTVNALYLPTVSSWRLASAAQLLAFLAPALREIPISVALTAARKPRQPPC